jgi:predicted proteasome-type protease
MHLFEQPGERVFILLSSGSLFCTQSIVTQLRRDFDQAKGLAQAPSLYDAARIIGEEVRRVSDLDRAALERRVQIQRQPDPRAARCAVRVRDCSSSIPRAIH